MKSLVILLCVLFNVHCLLAQDDAATLHKKISDQLSSAQTVKVEATISSPAKANVIITAKRTNKFVLQLPDRTIYCNGKDVWNYSAKAKSVTVSGFNPKSSSLSVEKLLLDIISRYSPKSVQTVGKSYQLLLEPSGTPIFGVKSITLTIDKKSTSITAIAIVGEQGKQSWKIKTLRLNVPVTDNTFTYKPTKGVELIDMRE
ncbi:MAG: outer-membrane lipoprotein carrier protein LolA [Candidatus Kapaibacterium sp.]